MLQRLPYRSTGPKPTGPGRFLVVATASEQRVAAMAVEGLSNPQIAQALFVSRKTVEMHLGNAYRKLDIGARGELSGVLGQSRAVA